MKVHAVIDIRSRWFELYADSVAAQRRADEMNANLSARYRSKRYHVCQVDVNETRAGQ